MSKLRDVFVFLGPPGSGKGSLSQLCIQELEWGHLSTGNVCRKHIIEKTDIGKAIDFAIKSGKLIDDDLIMRMVHEWINEIMHNRKAVILDGSPRTVAQAQVLYALVNDKNLNLTVVKLDISNELVEHRLNNRYTCQNKNCQAVFSLPILSMACNKCDDMLVRRPDDELDAIRQRLATYYHHVKGLIDFYQSNGCSIINLNVEKSLQSVFEDFKMLIGLKAA